MNNKIATLTKIRPRLYQTLLYDSFYKRYYEHHDSWTHELAMAEVGKNLINYININKIHAVLDIGCGAGRDVMMFIDNVAHICGVDIISHPNWADLEQKYSNMHFFAIDFLIWDTPQKFDLILDNGCFHHQHPANYDSYLTKVRRLLIDKGYFVLNTYFNDSGKVQIDSDKRIHRYFSKREISNLLSRNKLRVIYSSIIKRQELSLGNYLMSIIQKVN